MDFLKKYKALVDVYDESLKIIEDGHMFTIRNGTNIIDQNEEKLLSLKLENEIVLKPKTEHLTKLKITSKFKEGTDVLFDPKIDSKNFLKGIICASSLDTIREDNTINISLLNSSDNEVILEKGKEIGNLEIANFLEDMTTVASDPSEVKPDWNKIVLNPKLSPTEQASIIELLKKYEKLFQWSEYDIGITSKTEHSIDTGNTRPIKQAQYRLPQIAQDEIEKQIKSMLENKIIEESKSPWCSPILLVKKKPDENGNKSFRFCIDFRKLNSVTVKDSYPLPRIDSTVDALSGSKYFSTLDLASGFWQVPLKEDDKEKTAFTANSRLYQFTVMAFGLCNAPSTFQRLMDTILRNLTWKHCLVYLDDVIIFSPDFKTHLERLDQVLSRFKDANLKLKPSKCKFGMEEVTYLGFLISKEGLKPDPSKIKAISEYETPKNKEIPGHDVILPEIY